MKNDFNRPIQRKGTMSVKWDGVDKRFGDAEVLPMWVADMDFPSPPAVVQALQKRAELGVYGYTMKPHSYYDSLIGWIYKRHGWQVQKEWITTSPGVVTSLSILVSCFSEPGDKIIIQTPVYPPFYSVVKNNDRSLLMNPLVRENDTYQMDFAALENMIDRDVKLLILCNPHNPVGRVWTKEELQRLGEICLKHNILVISDEIHADLVYKAYSFTPFASISEEFAMNSITCMAPSKTFNIAGLQTSSVIISNPQLRKTFVSRLTALALNEDNYFAATATDAAYREGEEWLEELLLYLQENLAYLQDYFRQHIPQIRVGNPEGTYLVWLDCRELKMNGKQLKDFMVNEAKLGLNEGTTFGDEGEGFMRMNIACPKTTLQEGLRRLEKAVKQYVSRS